jgi:hypothetical protein
MRITGYALVGWSVVAGILRAWSTRRRRADFGELRYHVQVGQDAAAPLTALRQHGFAARIAMDGGYEDVVIVCNPERDREQVRTVLREAPVDLAGKVTEGAPIRFADEQRAS